MAFYVIVQPGPGDGVRCIQQRGVPQLVLTVDFAQVCIQPSGPDRMPALLGFLRDLAAKAAAMADRCEAMAAKPPITPGEGEQHHPRHAQRDDPGGGGR